MRDLHVLPARRRVAARMVVDQDDAGRGLPDDRVEDLPGMHDGCGEGTFGDLDVADLAVPVVEQDHVERLAFGVDAPGAEVVEDLLRRTHRLAGLAPEFLPAAPELHARLDAGRLGLPQALEARQLRHGRVVEAFQAAELHQQRAGVVHRVLVLPHPARPQQDGEQLGLRQFLRPPFQELLPRTVFHRPLADSRHDELSEARGGSVMPHAARRSVWTPEPMRLLRHFSGGL